MKKPPEKRRFSEIYALKELEKKWEKELKHGGHQLVS